MTFVSTSRRSRYPWLVVCAAAPWYGSAVQAQQNVETTAGGIQEVIVTAQKREESLQETPIAISALTADALAARGITDYQGVAATSPSITFTVYPSSPNTFILYMRGQGVSDAMQVTTDSAVGLYQDGFYISRPQLVTFDLADVERVEVLRGPQGTLYGRNTTGGAVNLISKKPSGEFGFKQELGFGNNGRIRSLTVLDLPKWGGLSAKLSLLKRQQDGFVKNIGSSHDFGEEDQTAGRLALRWDTGGPFTADYFHERGDLNSTPTYYTNPALVGLIPGYRDSGRPESRTYRAFDLPESKGKFETHGLTLAWNVNDALTLKSLTGYRDMNVVYQQDYADTFFVGFRSYDDVGSHQFSEELQAVGSLLDKRIDYVAGLYYFDESVRHYETVRISNVLNPYLPPGTLMMSKDRNVGGESKSKAAYAQVTWTPPVMNDRLSLTFGARYTQDDRSATRTQLNQALVPPYGFIPIGREPAPGLINANSVKSSRFDPSFTANFSWTDDVSTYLRVATGYKAGGSSESVDIGQFGHTFKPEDVKVFELGLKSYFLDRRVRVNAAVFDSKFDDMQMFFTTNPIDTSIVLAINAGKATVRGLELETLWQPVEDLSFNLDYTYLDAKFDRVLAPAGTIFDPAVNPYSPFRVGQDITKVFVMPYAPQNSLNAGVNWTFLKLEKGSLTGMLNYRWQDKVFDTAPAGPAVPGRNFYSRPAFGLVDARLSWKTELANENRVRVDLWSKNLTDQKWRAQVIGQGSPIAMPDPNTGYTTAAPAGWTSQAATWAERRTYGVNFVYEF
ncbi:MAG: TonB-dependent receptor [Gammaproteobacteria bacterium]|nr:TonB-dependent receptor [Gammaproteobacteria bacterium]